MSTSQRGAQDEPSSTEPGPEHEPAPETDVKTFEAWHGTPELFAHVIRVVQAVTSSPDRGGGPRFRRYCQVVTSEQNSPACDGDEIGSRASPTTSVSRLPTTLRGPRRRGAKVACA